MKLDWRWFKRRESVSSVDCIEGRLLNLAALFLVIYAAGLSISPAVRARSWELELRWAHWVGVAVWLIMIYLVHRQARRLLPNRDPFLLPIAALMSGWGVITIWRLLPDFGLRQSAWLLVGLGLVLLGLRLPPSLGYLRRYKYVWLTGSLLLTAMTFFFGTNPMGYGPRMWLGCCGIYLQPSEPLKLLLIAYLAAYFADVRPLISLSKVEPITTPIKDGAKRLALPLSAMTMLPLLAPTLIMTGLSLAILLVQRDLGTASIFLFFYAAILYMATDQKRFLILALLGVIISGAVGYYLFDVVRVRVDAWLNPWLDPSGRSYQIVQALLAVANGGLFGRGPGIGNPSLVPVVHSDLIYTALIEENGLMGAIALVALLGIFASRGLRAALRAPDRYRRFLAAGLTVYLVGQSIFIIGGSLRLVPLTGITLPFVSYGGSSLVTSFVSLLLLLHISNQDEIRPGMFVVPKTYHFVGVCLLSGLIALGFATGWWAVVRGPDLLTRTDNPRRTIADRSVQRGAILDRRNIAINASIGQPGSYSRFTFYPDLSNVVGYTDPTYGQSGLEASMDDYLRGLRGSAGLTIWWNHLLYGLPPPGLDVRLTIDLGVQRQVDNLLGNHAGAVVLINAETGEILAMTSHPTFNANQLSQTWDELVGDPMAPLLNRAVQGFYPVGDLEADLFGSGVLTGAAPQTRLPTGLAASGAGYSPLEVCLAAAAVSARGMRPSPLLVAAVDTAQSGWVLLQALEKPISLISVEKAQQAAQLHALPDLGIWLKTEVVLVSNPPDLTPKGITWSVAGSLPDWDGVPFAVVVVLEENDPKLAEEIARQVLLELFGR